MEEISVRVYILRENLQAAQSRQKGYADNWMRDLAFRVWTCFPESVTTEVLIEIWEKGKLSPRFIRPFEIIERVGAVAYWITFPPKYVGMHDVFHVSMLWKYQFNPNHIIQHEILPLERDLTYEEKPICILNQQERKLRSRMIQMVKMLWQHHSKEEATWERKDEMRINYPQLFEVIYKIWGINFFFGGIL